VGSQRVKEIYRVLGILCVGFEEQFILILIVIEVGCLQKVSGSISKLGSKGNRELKILECSICYDFKSETSSYASGN
jgi:hypothetical protein